MTQDDIIRMAHQSHIGDSHGYIIEHELAHLTRFAQLVATYEREECAKVCEERIDAEYKTGKVDHNEMAWTQACAIAIRARENK